MKLLLVILFSLNLYAITKQDIFHLYQNQEYKRACKLGFNHLVSNSKDEDFISIYAFSCLYSDYIDRLTLPITVLKSSKEARSNAAYFAVILMQKKLLYHAVVDKEQLPNLKLPTTDFILSKVFDLYIQEGKHIPKSLYIFQDPQDKHKSYKLYTIKEKNVNKLIIEELYDKISIQRHTYW